MGLYRFQILLNDYVPHIDELSFHGRILRGIQAIYEPSDTATFYYDFQKGFAT